MIRSRCMKTMRKRTMRTEDWSKIHACTCACVAKKEKERIREGEEGHVPLVARDQPNGFRLTPHVARKPVHPFSRHPCRTAGTAASKHASGNCYSIGSWI